VKKWVFLLRSFFPKWIFFDDVGPELRLEVCYGKHSEILSEWTNALTPIRRSFKNFLLNSHGNYLHACHNHLNHFNADVTDLEDETTVSELTTFQLTRNLSRYQIEQRQWAAPPFYFKFRLLVVNEGDPHVVLTSPIYEAE